MLFYNKTTTHGSQNARNNQAHRPAYARRSLGNTTKRTRPMAECQSPEQGFLPSSHFPGESQREILDKRTYQQRESVPAILVKHPSSPNQIYPQNIHLRGNPHIARPAKYFYTHPATRRNFTLRFHGNSHHSRKNKSYTDSRPRRNNRIIRRPVSRKLTLRSSPQRTGKRTDLQPFRFPKTRHTIPRTGNTPWR